MRQGHAGTLAAALVAVTFWLSTAPPVAACSCLETAVDSYVGASEWSIFTGTALPRQDLSVPFVVDEWFQGARPAAAVVLYTGEERQADGAISADTCGRALTPGRWLVFAVARPDGRLDPGSCSLTASLDEPDGPERLAAVQAQLEGQPPPTIEPTTDANDPGSGPGDPRLLLYVAAPVAVGAALFAVLALVARRRTH